MEEKRVINAENQLKVFKLLSGQRGTASMLFDENKSGLLEFLLPWKSGPMQLGRILKNGCTWQPVRVEIIGSDQGITVYKVL